MSGSYEGADLVVVNTCGFIEGAKKESIDHILKAARDRKPGAKLFVAGCLTERYREQIAQEVKGIDGILGKLTPDSNPRPSHTE